MKYIVCSDEEITDEMLNQIKEILLESRNPRACWESLNLEHNGGKHDKIQETN